MIYRKISGINNFDRIIRFDYVDAIADTNEIEFGIANRFFTRRSTENAASARSLVFSLQAVNFFLFCFITCDQLRVVYAKLYDLQFLGDICRLYLHGEC